MLAIPPSSAPSTTPFDNDMDTDPTMGNMPDVMGNEPNAMGDETADPSMENDSNAVDNENYGADFDAGVEASEEDDPKKFNQQLTGKLSQSLQKYEDGLGGQPDDLPKYVGGMILAQVAKYISPEEFDEMVKNAKDGMEPTEQQDNDTPPSETADDEENDHQDMNDVPSDEQPIQESVRQRINELFQNINKDTRSEKGEEQTDIQTKKTGPVGYKRKAKLPKDLKK